MQWPWQKSETDLEREMRYHLEAMADGFERQGMPRAEALKRARAEFGGIEQFKEQCRDERRWRPLSQLMQDLRFGIRMLRKAPAVTAAAVLSLALGIGATTAILSLVDAVLWRTLAVPNPEQLTEILWQSKGRPEGIYRNANGSMFPAGPLWVADFFSQPTFEIMREQASSLAIIAAHQDYESVSASYAGAPAAVQLRPVSGNFFATLGVHPFMGRLIGPGDEEAAVVVSHHFWQSVLRGDDKAIGRTLRINNDAYTIAGVLPAGFAGIRVGDLADLYTLIEHDRNPARWSTQLLARRKPGVSAEKLAAVLGPLFQSTWPDQPKDPATAPTIRLQNASGGLGDGSRQLREPLTLLFALVALVLLIACANIANLLLARADSRRKEVALRVSLGCGRARLVRQFLTESALLAVCGGVLSVAVAYVTANFAVTLMPGAPRLDFDIEGRMLLSTLGVTAFTALAFGLYPAWRASRTDAFPALKEGPGRGGKLLVLTQMALGVLLVAAAATFTGHLREVIARDTGFERTRLLLFDLRPGQSGFKGPRLRQFYLDLEQRLRSLPAVEAVGLAQVRPMRGGGYFTDVNLPGGAKPIGTAVNFVTAGYLRALGVPIVAGRAISERDVLSGAKVGVVSEDLAKALGGSPVGLTVAVDNEPTEIVGVAARARYDRLTSQPNVVYLPNSLQRDTATVLLRTAVPPARVLGMVRRTVGDLPMVKVFTMEEQIAETLRRERLFAWLCGSFGVLALLLCMIGLYGVMSYAAARRSQEIGIRMALGASSKDVLWHIVGEGMAVAALGLLLGAPVAYFAAQKYVNYTGIRMQAIDSAIIAWTVVALATSALLAVLAPALRAAKSDPVRALRQG